MFGPLSEKESAVLSRLPVISRARGHRLYGIDGTRWLDCWADGGRALAGHRPKGVSLRLKNEIDRGLYAPYPNLWERRLEKALLRMFPGYAAVRVYRNAERALELLGLDHWPVDPLDLSPGTPYAKGVLWGRPGLPDHPRGDVLFPILPLPGLSEAQPVLYAGTPSNAVSADAMAEHPAFQDAAETNITAPPTSDRISPLITAAMTRSCGSNLEKKSPQKFISAEIWDMRGPYMLFRGDEEAYDRIFEALFSRRILIAPSLNRPSILPAEFSPGEASVLAAGGC